MVTLSSRLVCTNFSVHIIIIIIIIIIITDTIDDIVNRMLDRRFDVRCPTRTRYVPRLHSPDHLWGSHRLILNVHQFFLQKIKRLNVKVASHLDLRPSIRTGGATCQSLLYVS